MASASTRTPLIARRAAPARARAQGWQLDWLLSPSAPRPTGRSSARRRSTAWSGSSRPSGSRAEPGVVPISSSQDTVGPLARSRRGCRRPPRGPRRRSVGRRPARRGHDEPAGRPARLTTWAVADADGLDGARIGVPRRALLRLQPEGRRPRRSRPAARPASRCCRRRSGRCPDCRGDLAEQRRADGDAARVQGGSRGILRHEAARQRPAAQPRRACRLQRRARAQTSSCTSARTRCSSLRGRRPRRPGLPRGAGLATGDGRGGTGSMPPSRALAWTCSPSRRWGRHGSSTT